MHKSLNDTLIEQFLAREVEHLSRAYKRARILDIGCGDLRYAKYLKFDGWEIIHADHEKRANGVRVLLDAHCLPFPKQTFDIVIMTEVLEHLHHPQLALNEISRILKPGGYLLITFPFLWQIHELPHDYFRFTEFGFYVLAQEANIHIERFERRGDSIALFLALVDMKLMGSIHLLSKTKYLYMLAIVLRPIASLFLYLVYSMYLKLSDGSNRMMNLYVGDNLAGPRGKLKLWHLGYNIVCKKG